MYTIDTIDRQYPLGTCVHDMESDSYGWVVGWTIYYGAVFVNIIVKGGWPSYANPVNLRKVSRSEVDAANR
jgi:hypothetical protein